MNKEIQALHEMLLAQHAALFEKVGEEEDPASARMILTEMREILHRIDMAQNVLFAGTSAALAASVSKVRQADAKLTKAIAHAAKTSEIVKAGTDFLKGVDKALDVAKKLVIV